MGPARRLGAGGLTMSWGACVELGLLLALGLGPGQRPGAWALQLRHECGSYSMQLLVFPRPGRVVHFKVVDEFGTRFEVTNCSICLHWITSEPQGAAIFSAGYQGCHVMKKDGQYHLRVFVEEMLGTQLDGAQDVTLICPKPELTKSLEASLPVFHLSPSPAWLHPRPPSHLHPHLHPLHPHLDSRHLSLPPVADGDHRPTSIYPTWSSPSSHPVTLVHRISPNHTATIQCLEDGHFVLVISKNTTSEKRVSLKRIRLAYASDDCIPTQRTENFVVFHFPVTQCGTTIQLVNNQLIYENQLVSDIDIQMGPEGAITRDSTFLDYQIHPCNNIKSVMDDVFVLFEGRMPHSLPVVYHLSERSLHARCIYNASNFQPLLTEVFLPPPPPSVLQSGPLHLELRIATDQEYSSYYREKDFPIFKKLREPIYVEVRLLRRKDPNLVLVLHHCWATPSTNPFKEPQWPLLVDGCPFAGDSYKTQLASKKGAEPLSPTHYQRFTVFTFTFVDSVSQRALSRLVYFFCSASACHPSETETCRAVCHPWATKRRRFVDHHHYMEGVQDIVGSPGPVGFGDSKEQKTDLQNKASPSMKPESKEGSVILWPNTSEPLLPERSSWNTALKPLLWVTLSLVIITVLLVVAALFGRSPKLQEQSRACEQGQ